MLTTLPGVAVVRASGFAAFSLPINRYPDAEHLYSATGLAPALYSLCLDQAPRPDLASGPGRAPRRPDGHRLGPVPILAGLHPRDAEYRARGMTAIQARVALARHACRLAYRLLKSQQPFDEQAYSRARHSRGR